MNGTINIWTDTVEVATKEELIGRVATIEEMIGQKKLDNDWD
jgi:hypothetical protein